MSRRDARMIKHRVLLAAGNFGETCQVRKHRPGAILAKDMQQGPLCWELVRGEVARDHCEAPLAIPSGGRPLPRLPNEPSHWKVCA